MLKQTVTYTDFNDQVVTEDLYFNLSRTELMDLLDIQPRLEAWREKNQTSNTQELSTSQVKELLEILKLLIEKSYGERSDDGKHFRKTPAIFADFKDSPAYDELIFSMFTQPDNAVRFMTGIMPTMLAEEIRQAIQDVDLPAQDVQTGGEQVAVDTEIPAWIRENRDPTNKEMQGMTQGELIQAYQRKAARKQAEA